MIITAYYLPAPKNESLCILHSLH